MSKIDYVPDFRHTKNECERLVMQLTYDFSNSLLSERPALRLFI